MNPRILLDEPGLFAMAADERSDAPRCRMCPRPARWINTACEWGMYCAGRSCSNRERLCQACGALFEMGHSGAGTKYCSDACKRVGYKPGAGPPPVCAWCETAVAARRAAGGIWPFVCDPCLQPIRKVVGRLKEHRVPIQMARRLLTDSGCEVCGRDLLALAPAAATGRLQAPLVVDHDHRCCPGAKSCGRCVRGFLCGTCNSAAGLLRDDPAVANRMASYLSNTSERVA